MNMWTIEMNGMKMNLIQSIEMNWMPLMKWNMNWMEIYGGNELNMKGEYIEICIGNEMIMKGNILKYELNVNM